MIIILSITLLLPHFAYGEVSKDIGLVVNRGYFGAGGLNLNQKMNRAELATVTIRLMDLVPEAESYKGKAYFKDTTRFQAGWSMPYAALAYEQGIMSGKTKDSFNPSGNVSYVEMLTVLMRILEYKDGIDFVKYPDDYYRKALEIGLADFTIPHNKEVLRETIALTMVKALNMNIKGKDYTLLESLDSVTKKETPTADITISDIIFNTTISGLFSGQLKGINSFTGYRIVLLSKNGTVYGEEILDRTGKFNIAKFDIGILAKLQGYKYELYDNKGSLILEDIVK